MTAILLKQRDGANVEFSDEGVRYRSIAFTWAEVEYVSITPSVKLTDAGWKAFNSEQVPWNGDLVELKVVVKDRRPIIARTGNWWRRLVARMSFQAMGDVDWKSLPDQAVMTFTLYRDDQPITWAALFDFINAKTKLGLVVTF